MKMFITVLFIMLSTVCKADTLTIGTLGVTVHGITVNKRASRDMPRKITDNGSVVWNPELNTTLIKENGLTFNGTLISDCYNSTAYYFGSGKTWIFGNHNLQAIIGIYFRHIPDQDEDYSISPPSIGNYQYFPLPWIGYGYSLPISKEVSLNLQIDTNYFLTHAVVGVTFQLP